MPAPAQRLLVTAAIAAMVGIWGTTWAAIRVSLEGIPPYAGLGARFLLAGAVLLALGFVLGVPSQRGPRLYRLWLVETVFGLLISYGVVYWAEDRGVPSGLASVLFATFPLFVALLAHLWLPNEPLRLSELFGTAAAVGGVLLLFSDDLALPHAEARWAAGVLFASPVAAAVSHVLIKRWGSGIHPINMVTVPMLMTGSAMTLVSRWAEADRGLSLGWAPVAATVYLAIPGSVLTFTLYYWALERVAATRLSLMTLGFPIVAVVVGAALFGETLNVRTVGGTGLVLFGVALAMLRGRSGSASSSGTA